MLHDTTALLDTRARWLLAELGHAPDLTFDERTDLVIRYELAFSGALVHELCRRAERARSTGPTQSRVWSDAARLVAELLCDDMLVAAVQRLDDGTPAVEPDPVPPLRTSGCAD